jgi:hypothetical protein
MWPVHVALGVSALFPLWTWGMPQVQSGASGGVTRMVIRLPVLSLA